MPKSAGVERTQAGRGRCKGFSSQLKTPAAQQAAPWNRSFPLGRTLHQPRIRPLITRVIRSAWRLETSNHAYHHSVRGIIAHVGVSQAHARFPLPPFVFHDSSSISVQDLPPHAAPCPVECCCGSLSRPVPAPAKGQTSRVLHVFSEAVTHTECRFPRHKKDEFSKNTRSPHAPCVPLRRYALLGITRHRNVNERFSLPVERLLRYRSSASGTFLTLPHHGCLVRAVSPTTRSVCRPHGLETFRHPTVRPVLHAPSLVSMTWRVKTSDGKQLTIVYIFQPGPHVSACKRMRSSWVPIIFGTCLPLSSLALVCHHVHPVRSVCVFTLFPFVPYLVAAFVPLHTARVRPSILPDRISERRPNGPPSSSSVPPSFVSLNDTSSPPTCPGLPSSPCFTLHSTYFTTTVALGRPLYNCSF